MNVYGPRRAGYGSRTHAINQQTRSDRGIPAERHTPEPDLVRGWPFNFQGGTMTTMQACGTGFGTGLVVAVTAAIIWRSRPMSRLILWIFSRGDR